MQVLVVNVGSNSLKLRVLDEDGTATADRDVDPWDPEHPTGALVHFLEQHADVDAVGHRIVHGGNELVAPTVIDDAVVKRIGALTSLAPIHQPRALTALRMARDTLPDVPHVACFDTAFHATMPEAASTYAVPQQWRDRWPVRRFGFHGLSHRWAVGRAAAVAERPHGSPPLRRVISCHLGGGGSLCAALDGRSIDTTMGFTPLEGLVMVGRSGTVDPGLVLWLITEGGLSPEEVDAGLGSRGGLRALGGGSGDMREVRSARAEGDGAATLAYDVYVHSLRRHIGAMAASLGGVDALVFTGGLAEHSPDVRADAIAPLAHLGLHVDPARNDQAHDDADISPADSEARVLVVASREDREIATEVRELLGAEG